MILTNFTYKFKTTRILGNTVASFSSSFKLDFNFSAESSDDELEDALSNIRRLFSVGLNNSVVFSYTSKIGNSLIFSSDKIDNLPIGLWDEPSDPVLAIAILSKIKALSNGAIIPRTAIITSDNEEMCENIITIDELEHIPSMQDLFGEHAPSPDAWWARNDGSTFDVAIPPDYKGTIPFVGFALETSKSNTTPTTKRHTLTVKTRK